MRLPTVVVAEDDPALRELLRLTLQSSRFELIQVADGHSALAEARRQIPDLVFLDWVMPALSGLEVCRALRADPAYARTRIVMITARGRERDRHAAEAAGVDEFLTKPFSPIRLLDTVGEVLGPAALLE